jgi:hypothetical protein
MTFNIGCSEKVLLYLLIPFFISRFAAVLAVLAEG